MSNAADRKRVDAAARREKGARRSDLKDVSDVMGTVRGRSLAYRILEKTGCNAPLPFSANAMSLARDVGVQSVGYWLLAEIREACPHLELVMRQEAAQLAERLQLQQENEDGPHDHE